MTAVPAQPPPSVSLPLSRCPSRHRNGQFSSVLAPPPALSPSLPPHPGSVERRRRRRWRLARSSNPRRRPIPGAAGFSNTELNWTCGVTLTKSNTLMSLNAVLAKSIQSRAKFGDCVSKVKESMQKQRCSAAPMLSTKPLGQPEAPTLYCTYTKRRLATLRISELAAGWTLLPEKSTILRLPVDQGGPKRGSN